MTTHADSSSEIRVTVNGAEFYSLIRAMKRSYRTSDLGDVTISVQDGKMSVETKRGGGVFPCNDAPPVTARLLGGRFLQLASLVADAKASGPCDRCLSALIRRGGSPARWRKG